MREKIKPLSKFASWFYFWAGITATFSYRIIVVLNNYSPLLVDIAWYTGTIGFIIYFFHRFKVSQRREKLIVQYRLVEKVNKIEALSEEEKYAMRYIFRGLRSTKEKYNYYVIFALSWVALLWGIYQDFLVDYLK